MHMVRRQHSFDDLNAQFLASLADDFAQPNTHLATQHLEPIFGHPNDVKSVVIFRMTSIVIGLFKSTRHLQSAVLWRSRVQRK